MSRKEYQDLIDEVLRLQPNTEIPSQLKQRIQEYISSDPEAASHFAELGAFVEGLRHRQLEDVPPKSIDMVNAFIQESIGRGIPSVDRPRDDDYTAAKRFDQTNNDNRMEPKRTDVGTRQSRVRRRLDKRPNVRIAVGLGILAAACVALAVFWPNGATQGRYIVAATSTVATDTMGSPDEFYRITVELQRPAFVRLAARDCNGMVALAAKGVSTDSEEAVAGLWQGSLNTASLDDPNCLRSHAFVIAGPSRLPDELEVLAQTPSDATADRLAEALESAKHEIEVRFGSEVRIIPLPPTP